MGKIIGIGETVMDIIFKDDQPQQAVPGGSTFNAVVSLGRAGVPCAIVTEAGDDHVGDITCKYLMDNGVGTEYVTRRKGTQSHISLAFLDDKNDAQYTFYKDHKSVAINSTLPEVSGDDIVLFGSFFAINPVIRPQVRDMLKKAHDSGATLYYDINFRASHIKDIPETLENIRENMAMSSVVRGSLEDFGYLFGETDVDVLYEKHIRPYCEFFICTNGGEPIELRTPTLSAQFPATKIKTVSTIGAGDNFNAGFVYALMKSGNHPLTSLSLDEWAELIKTGQRFAADVCQSYQNAISHALGVKLKVES